MTPEQKNAIIVNVACPQCGAAAGEICRRPNGKSVAYVLHLDRRDAAFAAGVYTAS